MYKSQKIALVSFMARHFRIGLGACSLTKHAVQKDDRITKNFILNQYDLSVRERRRASNAVKKKATFDVLLDLFHKSHIRSDDL